jgi:hypothetical protein
VNAEARSIEIRNENDELDLSLRKQVFDLARESLSASVPLSEQQALAPEEKDRQTGLAEDLLGSLESLERQEVADVAVSFQGPTAA